MKADRERAADLKDMASFGIVDPMVVVDDASTIVSLNPAAQRLFDTKPAGAVGKPLERVWPQWFGNLERSDFERDEPCTISLGANHGCCPRYAYVYPVIGPHNERIGRAIIVSGFAEGERVAGDHSTLSPGQPLPATDGQPARLDAVVGSGSDVARVLTHVAWQLGQAADATSVYICGWDPNIEIAIVLAEYIGPHASPSERVSDLGTCYVDSRRRFMEALRAGHHWVEHLDDPSTPSDDRRHMEFYGARSILYIPFTIREQLAGWAEIWESRRRRAFSRRTVALAESIAQIAAVAISKAQLYERVQEELAERQRAEAALRQLNDELEERVSQRTVELAQVNADLLTEVAERRQTEADLLQRNRMLLSLQSAIASTTGSLDLEFLLDTITWEMTHLLNFESCTVYHWDGRSNELNALAGANAAVGSSESAADLGESPLYRRILEEMSAVHLTAGQTDLDRLEAQHLQKTGAKSLVLIPMIFHGRTVGLIELMDRTVERILGDYEISAAQLLTSQVAAAIENAQLYGHAQREISDRIQAEDLLRASLAEKDVLLKEIHHRVKNNLQVISSMLSLQAYALCDPAALKAFAESQDRIRSMALIHEKLYRSQDLAGIEFGSYLKDLAAYLIRSYQRRERPIELHIEADGVRLGVDQAVPCGLIVNELVSNALKHAFPAGAGHRISGSDMIHIRLESEREGYLSLIVGDNGVGFPQNVDFDHTDSLGLQIVNTLVGQLDGEISLNGTQGAEFKITFPVLTN
jgi:two-component sensor histidine kinase